MLRFEREENGSYNVELYEEIKLGLAVEMISGFEEVFILDENNSPIKFELFADLKEMGIDSIAELALLKFFKKVDGE